jgi:hypothetical protein
MMLKSHKWGCFIAYWPILYLLSSKFKGATLVGFTAAYAWGYTMEQKWIVKMLQSSLNRSAAPFA